MVIPSIRERVDEYESLVRSGRRKIEWARQHMPILDALRSTFRENRPLAGQRLGMAMHLETKTAVLVETLVAGGAEVAITGCDPLTTEDDVSAALDAQEGVTSYGRRDTGEERFHDALRAVLAFDPTLTIDDGCNLVALAHEERPDLVETVLGGCEETTTGVHRLHALADDGVLEYPVFAVNDTPMKTLFDNVHGTGESTMSHLAMMTNLSITGKTVVVGGYGYCGTGVAKKAAGMNADVIVTEVDERRGLEAHMEGYDVMPMAEAAKEGDVFVTTTGNRDVITREHFESMADGAVLANAGHFDVEIDLDALSDLAVDERRVREGVVEYETPDGRRLNVLASGRLVNLAGPDSMGHPIEVIDQSFGMQAICTRELVANGEEYAPGVHDVPDALDREVARIKLDAEGIEIDDLTGAQREYMDSWEQSP
jgi:adenosylhomocysteinase